MKLFQPMRYMPMLTLLLCVQSAYAADAPSPPKTTTSTSVKLPIKKSPGQDSNTSITSPKPATIILPSIPSPDTQNNPAVNNSNIVRPSTTPISRTSPKPASRILPGIPSPDAGGQPVVKTPLAPTAVQPKSVKLPTIATLSCRSEEVANTDQWKIMIKNPTTETIPNHTKIDFVIIQATIDLWANLGFDAVPVTSKQHYWLTTDLVPNQEIEAGIYGSLAKIQCHSVKASIFR